MIDLKKFFPKEATNQTVYSGNVYQPPKEHTITHNFYNSSRRTEIETKLPLIFIRPAQHNIFHKITQILHLWVYSQKFYVREYLNESNSIFFKKNFNHKLYISVTTEYLGINLTKALQSHYGNFINIIKWHLFEIQVY